MSENVSHEDFNKLSQAMTELALLMCTGLNEMRQVVTLVKRDQVDPPDPRAPTKRRPLDRIRHREDEAWTDEKSDLFDYPQRPYRRRSLDPSVWVYQRRQRDPVHMYEGGDDYDPMDHGRRNNGNGYGEYWLKMDLPYFNGNLHIE